MHRALYQAYVKNKIPWMQGVPFDLQVIVSSVTTFNNYTKTRWYVGIVAPTLSRKPWLGTLSQFYLILSWEWPLSDHFVLYKKYPATLLPPCYEVGPMWDACDGQGRGEKREFRLWCIYSFIYSTTNCGRLVGYKVLGSPGPAGVSQLISDTRNNVRGWICQQKGLGK